MYLVEEKTNSLSYRYIIVLRITTWGMITGPLMHISLATPLSGACVRLLARLKWAAALWHTGACWNVLVKVRTCVCVVCVQDYVVVGYVKIRWWWSILVCFLYFVFCIFVFCVVFFSCAFAFDQIFLECSLWITLIVELAFIFWLFYSFCTLAFADSLSLLECSLETGRTHRIRARTYKQTTTYRV